MADGDARSTVRQYYDALQHGEPLQTFFADGESVVKFGISEHLRGSEAVADGLRSQTRHTTEWSVESRALQVTDRECHAWFSDAVRMAWTDTDTGTRRAFDTRWSGTLENREGWAFVGMHVSVAREF
jgi:hypothetical protein